MLLCEGFSDRSFLAGWLSHLGCSEARCDPWGKSVSGGHFGYLAPEGRFIRVVPAHGRDNLLSFLKTRLGRRSTETLEQLAIVCDRDDCGRGGQPDPHRLTAESVEGALRAIGAQGVETRCAQQPRQWQLDQGQRDQLTVTLLQWSAAVEAELELPSKQTLERLACGAIHAVYPDRTRSVRAWLDGRSGNPPAAGPKEHLWSHMAGWYADYGCDAFWRALWQDPLLAAALRQLLEAAGLWPVVEALVTRG